jgi:hypothetical protein
MAAPVHSVRLWSVVEAPLDFPSIGPQVPAGFVWVVRDVRMINVTLGEAILNAVTLLIDNGATIYQTPNGCTIGQQMYGWQGRAIVQPGEQLQLFLPDPGWTVAVDGYQLTLP